MLNSYVISSIAFTHAYLHHREHTLMGRSSLHASSSHLPSLYASSSLCASLLSSLYASSSLLPSLPRDQCQLLTPTLPAPHSILQPCQLLTPHTYHASSSFLPSLPRDQCQCRALATSLPYASGARAASTTPNIPEKARITAAHPHLLSTACGGYLYASLPAAHPHLSSTACWGCSYTGRSPWTDSQ